MRYYGPILEKYMKSFKKNIEDAKKKFVGNEPNILALPKAFTTTAMHICMKD